jgi:hypothetical protein
MSNSADVALSNGRKVNLVQQTRYPWDGVIKITVNPEQSGNLSLKLRIPGWAHGQAVPSDLYRFENASIGPNIELKVNGKRETLTLDKGYATVTRDWHKGDSIELVLPMPIRRVEANEKVAADLGKVALERGPLVYAAEWPDSPDKHVRNLLLADDDKLKAEFRPAMLGGVEVIEGKAEAYRYNESHQLDHKEQKFTAIPYYAWANRGPGQMEVWIADTTSAVHPAPYPTLAMKSTVTASGSTVTDNGVKDPGLVADGEEPASSNDGSSFYDWAPKKGSEEWIQYEFPQATQISSSQVYWFAEPGHGQVKAPANWRILYKEGMEWKPVETTQPYGLRLDAYNTVTFKPVETKALRLEVQQQPNFSAGVAQWTVK